MKFDAYINKEIKRIYYDLESFFPKKITLKEIKKYVGKPYWPGENPAYTQVISKPLWELISRNGKHWRPLFGLFMLDALGVKTEDYRSLIVVFPEMAHTGSLIIDDIQDGSFIRRNEKCLHLTYGLDVSINAANAAYFLPYALISCHPLLNDKKKLEVYGVMSRHYIRAHLGQGSDIYWSKNMSHENLKLWMRSKIEDKILQSYAYKTASTVEAIVEVCCVIAGSGKRLRKACVDFARSFGVAFQIMDDLGNLKEPRLRNKKFGEDIRSGKLTYVIVKSLKRLSGRKRQRLEDILCNHSLRSKDYAVKEGIRLIQSSGSLRICRIEARRLVKRQWKRLSGMLKLSRPKALFNMLMKRYI